jgi:hypothetical protein
MDDNGRPLSQFKLARLQAQEEKEAKEASAAGAAAPPQP